MTRASTFLFTRTQPIHKSLVHALWAPRVLDGGGWVGGVRGGIRQWSLGMKKQRWVGSRLSFHMSVYDHFCLCHPRSCSVEGRRSELQWVIFNKGISRGALIGGGSDLRCVQLFIRCVWNSSWWMWRNLVLEQEQQPPVKELCCLSVWTFVFLYNKDLCDSYVTRVKVSLFHWIKSPREAPPRAPEDTARRSFPYKS